MASPMRPSVGPRVVNDRIFPPTRPWTQLGPQQAITDGTTYQHLCEAVMADDGSEVVGYIDGDNHGTRNDESVFLPQKLDAAGSFVLDGTDVVDGEAVFSTARRPFLYSSDDETDVTFSVHYTLNGVPAVLNVTGPQRTDPAGAYYRRKYLDIYADSIQEVETDKATNGEVYMGTRESPSDLKSARISGGHVVLQTISEGRQSNRRHYWACMGKHSDGTILHPYTRFDGDADPGKNRLLKSTDNGVTFTGQDEIIFSGMGTYVSPFIQYTAPVMVPGSSRMVSCVQRGGLSYQVYSDDKCQSFTGAVFANCPDITFTNIATINTAAKRFGLDAAAGNLAAEYAAGDFIGASSAGNNNNGYSVASATYGVDPADGVTRTLVTVNESIASAVVAGRLRSISISEHAMACYDANNWIIIGRINGVIAQMYAWKTTDAGATWSRMGRLGLTRSGGWVSPFLNIVRKAGRTWVVFWVFARGSTSAPPPNAGCMVCYAAEYSKFIADPATIGTGPAFVIGREYSAEFGRSGYPSPIFDPVSLVGSMVWGTEVARNRARLERQYVNLNTFLDSLA